MGQQQGVLGMTCPHGDASCPCQDGDACHYVDLPGSPAMPAPDTVELNAQDAATELQALLGVPDGTKGVQLPE